MSDTPKYQIPHANIYVCCECGFIDDKELRYGVNNHWRKGYTERVKPPSAEAICYGWTQLVTPQGNQRSAMSDTPRTELNICEVVFADFARTLERDLAAAQAKIVELNDALAKATEAADAATKGVYSQTMLDATKAISKDRALRFCITELKRERDALRTLPHIETVAANVHAAWAQAKKSAGIKSRLAEDGEELMVPYAELSDKQQEMDRLLVRHVYAAIDAAREGDAK